MQKTIRLPFPAADPFILCAADGRYYLYCTSEDGSGFPIYTSEDLQFWERCGTALGKETSRWDASGHRNAMRLTAYTICFTALTGK